MPGDYYYVPRELDDHSDLKKEYEEACQALFQGYFKLIDGCVEYLRETTPRVATERDGAFNGRISRIATDHCRAVLPAATLTNVGVTANARTLEHAISKLASSDLLEEQSLGDAVREQGKLVTPTLIKYAERVEYLADALRIQSDYARKLGLPDDQPGLFNNGDPEVRLVHWDRKGAVSYTHLTLPTILLV